MVFGSNGTEAGTTDAGAGVTDRVTTGVVITTGEITGETTGGMDTVPVGVTLTVTIGKLLTAGNCIGLPRLPTFPSHVFMKSRACWELGPIGTSTPGSCNGVGDGVGPVKTLAVLKCT
jgi:hypothetical protein